jgi:hypothetical protein
VGKLAPDACRAAHRAALLAGRMWVGLAVCELRLLGALVGLAILAEPRREFAGLSNTKERPGRWCKILTESGLTRRLVLIRYVRYDDLTLSRM